MNLKATMAVLSSCESGLGKVYKGEGMLSMANAFAYSGCNNMVLGLWKVNDQVSIRLMEKFYEGLLQGHRMDAALTMAKRNYLAEADELTAHPKMWGALVSYGNQQVISKQKGKWIIASVALVALMLIVGVLWMKKLGPFGSGGLNIP